MKFKHWGLAGLILLLLAFMMPVVSAQTRNPTIDVKGVDIDSSRLSTAAQSLINEGAQVVIVATSDAGSSRALDYLDARLRALNIANSSNASDLPANAVIYYVSVSPRESWIFYGSTFSSALSGETESLRNNYLNPQLQRGNFTGGFVDTMSQTARIIDNPVGARQPESSPAGSAIVWIVALVALGALAVFVIPALLRRRSATGAATNALDAARQRWTAAKQAAGAVIADTGRQMSDAQAKQQFDRVSYPPTQVQELERRQQAAEAQFRRAQEQFDDLNERIDGLPNPTVTDLDGAAGGYDGVRVQVQEVSKALDDMDGLRKQLDTIAAQAPQEVDRAKKW